MTYNKTTYYNYRSSYNEWHGGQNNRFSWNQHNYHQYSEASTSQYPYNYSSSNNNNRLQHQYSNSYNYQQGQEGGAGYSYQSYHDFSYQSPNADSRSFVPNNVNNQSSCNNMKENKDGSVIASQETKEKEKRKVHTPSDSQTH